MTTKAKNFSPLLILSILLTLCIGCHLAKTSPRPAPVDLSLDEIIKNYNDNFYKIPKLKATISQWTLDFVEPIANEQGELENKYHHYNELGGVLFFKPGIDEDDRGSFYLQTRAPANPEALVIASNENEFWMYTLTGKFGFWGKYKDLGKLNTEDMFFDPQLLLDFIGWRPLNSKAVRPAYKIFPEKNILECIEFDGRGLRIAREIIFDRYTNLPTEINGYSWDGQLVIHSQLDNYIEFGDDKALVPTKILISFPVKESSMLIRLDKYRPSTRDKTSLFSRPESIEGVDDYRQITDDNINY
ncbi:MAG: hypothetical protein JEZ07_16745 [Phycisphaerae bacterium]|nr:hypothetical protein [Phycisphaerae bacterium]